MLSSHDMACIFRPAGKNSVFDALDAFLKNDKERVFRISLKHIPFGHDTREVVVNALGRHLLALARDGRFREQPLVVFLDEAHQFLNKHLGDENTRYALDSFELIAKEGRKFSLNICLATQRPRDLPEGILSQVGTLVVHRLTNDKDREVVERASGDIDRSAAAFLPTLVPGQAVIIGVDFPMPLTVQIIEPQEKPDSRGPDYQKFWRATEKIDGKKAAPLQAMRRR
jgi:DNA helicase HerA-like ATPase